MEALKLTALDAEDLAIVSAHLQDAVLRVGDIKYLKRPGKFVLAVNRFAWEKALKAEARERRHTALHFERVKSVKAQRIVTDDPDGILSLLAIEFSAGDPPSGTVTLRFSGGGTLKLEVDCIEARFEDLGPAWETPHQPRHDA